MTLLFDQEQICLLEEIKEHLDPIIKPRRQLSALTSMNSRAVRGVYVYGPVGRGKTSVIEYIFNKLPEPKQKYHFDHFSTELYHHLQHMSITNLLHTLYLKGRIIWIDELQIYDIGTAMLLRKLIPEMIKHKMIVLITGNVEPINFYKNGLNRDQFEGFIPFFYENFRCFPLNGEIDYRRLNNANTPDFKHLWLQSDQSHVSIKNTFSALSPHEVPTSFTLMLNQRHWQLIQTIGAAVFVDFQSLAEENHAASDYKTLVETFPVVLVHNVPIFTHENRDACRRFMAFIDILYDQKGTLFMESAAMPDHLYQDIDKKLPFERTASRLNQLLQPSH